MTLARYGVLAAIGFGASAAWAHRLVTQDVHVPSPELPRASGANGYVSSAACLPCHPGEHASFGRTFHRTMTQEATDHSVLAPFPRDPRGSPTIDGHAIVMTTGSHRQQAYWTASERPGELRISPWIWLVRERRMIPRTEAFLHPPDDALPNVRWGSSCIACHATAGEPHHDERRDAFALRAAELGIACEACHGPGAAHVARHRDPIERWTSRTSKAPDPTIAHPRKVAKERSVAVCGQCHAYAFPKDVDAFWTHGYARSFRAGDRLDDARTLLAPGKDDAVVDRPEDALFWADGTVRVGGRETNGLLLSKCFTKGELTCVSCHAMHAGDPAGQIDPQRAGDAACTTCHAATKEHSHHAEGSPGRACVACHMPRTSYALLSAVRSHRIDVPSAETTETTARPNACNLCHLDRSLGWTDRTLAAWFGTKRHEGLDDRSPRGAMEALSGDAAVRVIVADALGDARSPAPAPFRAQLLRPLARDPYAAIRFVAARSLEGVADVPGPLDEAWVRALLAARDDRKVTIAE